MNDYTDYGTISVCSCCMLIHANGECGGEDYPAGASYECEMRNNGVEWPANADYCQTHDHHHENTPWSAFPVWEGWEAAMGGEHAEGCTAETREAEGCTCDELGFSWSPCEACGSPLGGDRFAFTLWRRMVPASS